MFYLILLAVSLSISVSSMPLLRRLALKYNIMIDIPNERKIHVKAIPRNGGIGIALASFTAILLGYAIREGISGEEFLPLTGIILGGVFILVLGILDDMRGMNAYEKFTGQTFAAIILFLAGMRIETISIPFWHVVHLPLSVSIFITIFWVLAVTNALNFIDGMDGLAAGVALIASTILFILSLLHGEIYMAIITISLIGGCLGFLRYNYPPASIFMGDCGSMFLGFILAAASIQCSYKSSTAASILIPVTILGVPLMDTALAIARRLWRKQSPFSADKEHVHHQLLDLGLNTKHAGLILYGFCGFLGVVALTATLVNDEISAIIITVAGIILIIASLFISQINKKRDVIVKKKEVAPIQSDRVKRKYGGIGIGVVETK